MKIAFLLLPLLLSTALSMPVQHPLVRQVSLRTASLQLPTVRQGKNFDTCQNDDDCDGTRSCAGLTMPQAGGLCQEGEVCQCAALESPLCPPNECDEGETCARLQEDQSGICVSDTVIAESDGAIVPVGDGTQPPSTTATTESTTTVASTTAATGTTVTGDDDGDGTGGGDGMGCD